jgi:type VI secretion system protein ImpH
MAMADSIWGTGRRLDAHLYQAGYEFDFFQAVRLLTIAQSERSSDGGFHDPEEVLRFVVEPSLLFPPSPITTIDRLSDGLARMGVAFLGMIGSSSVLPLAYTEMAAHRKSLGDRSFAAFFDIFHNRLLSLLYRAWEKHHFVIGYEKAQRDPGARDPLTTYLFDLIGMGTAGLENRLPFPDFALLRYAGLLAQRPRSAECLRAVVQDFFGIPTKIEQFVGRWHRLETDEQCILGAATHTSRLGEGTLAGDMIWSRQASIRVVLGPMSAQQFFDMLPGGTRFVQATALIRWFLGPTIEFQIQPTVAAGETPDWCKLGEKREAGPMLGWCTWLGNEPFLRPAGQAIFSEAEGSRKQTSYAPSVGEAYA